MILMLIAAALLPAMMAYADCLIYPCSAYICGEQFNWCCDQPCDVGCGDATSNENCTQIYLWCTYDPNCGS